MKVAMERHFGQFPDGFEILGGGRPIGGEAVEDVEDVLIAGDDPGVQKGVPVNRIVVA